MGRILKKVRNELQNPPKSKPNPVKSPFEGHLKFVSKKSPQPNAENAKYHEKVSPNGPPFGTKFRSKIHPQEIIF